VVWVVGATRGLGREIAKQFAEIGCAVCLSGRNSRQLRSAAHEIARRGGTAHAFPLDIRNPRAVPSTARKISKLVGEVDVLVTNAGVTVFKSFVETSLAEFNDLISTNLVGHINCIKSVLPAMIRRKHGWIINIISNAAVKTFEESAAYTATKAGMLGVGRVLREEMREHGVKVVNVIPGAIDTTIWSPRVRERYGERMMQAKSVAEAVVAAYTMPGDVVVDEIVLRPLLGDLS